MNETKGEQLSNKAAYLALGHFVIDLYPAFLPPLLPLLIGKFHLSLTSASVLALVLSFSTSLTQPLFGYLSDKRGGRHMMMLGTIAGGISMSLIGLASSYSLIVLLLITGGLGIAAYHPEAAALTVSLGGRRKTLGMSLCWGGTWDSAWGPF